MIRKSGHRKKKSTGQESMAGWWVFLVAGVMFFNGYILTRVNNLEKLVNGKVQAAPEAKNQVPEQVTQPPPQPQQNLTALPEITDKDYVRGDINADVVLVEYSDYECPFCKRFHPTMQQITKDYGSKVAWVFRHYPLPFHPKAQKSAEAAECAGELGGKEAFWKMTDAIFEKMPAMESTDLPSIAVQAGVNKGKFQTCLDSGKYADKIKEEQNGGSQAGVSGTPGTIIVSKNGKREFIPGALPIDQVKQLIDKVI